MPPENSTDNTQLNQDIRSILEENNRLLKEVKAGNTRLERYLRWNRIWSFLRLLIIVIPIILGIIFLKPYVKNAFSEYRELLGSPSADGVNQSLDILDQLKQYQQVGN